jgi:hypothetical protein
VEGAVDDEAAFEDEDEEARAEVARDGGGRVRELRRLDAEFAMLEMRLGSSSKVPKGGERAGCLDGSFPSCEELMTAVSVRVQWE